MKTLFSSAWLDAISCCGKDLQLKIIRAVIHYQETGQMPEQMTPSVRMALRLIIAMSPEDTATFAAESTPEGDCEKVEVIDAENDSDMEAADAEGDAHVGVDEARAAHRTACQGLSPIGKILLKARKSERRNTSKKRLKK